MLQEEKKKFRKLVKAVVNKFCQDKALCLECEKSACNEFTKSDLYKNADILIAYLALEDELSINLIIKKALEENKKVAVPKIVSETELDFYFINDLEKDLIKEEKYGILEPFSACKKVCFNQNMPKITILVPGRAFNLYGERIGRGKGYYDRFLAMLEKNKINANICGVSYSVQITKDFPVEENDYIMQYLLCEYGIIKTAKKSN